MERWEIKTEMQARKQRRRDAKKLSRDNRLKSRAVRRKLGMGFQL